MATPSSFISPDQCTALDEDKSPSPKKRSFDDMMNESSPSCKKKESIILF